MSGFALLITLLVGQNIVLVNYLAPWAFFSRLQSPRQSLHFSLLITGATVWVAVLFALVFPYVLEPLNVVHAATIALVIVQVLSFLLWRRVGQYVLPYHWGLVNRLALVSFLNVTVFVVSMALALAEVPLWQVPLGALFAGVGMLAVMVPVAATRNRMELGGGSAVLDGAVVALLATAVFALLAGYIAGAVEGLILPLF